MRISPARFSLILVLLVVLPACGRSSLVGFNDAATGTDTGVLDGGIDTGIVDPDGGIDTGVPPFDAGPDGGCRGDGECDDGVFCNGQEQCVRGLCVGSDPVVCWDGVDCTRDECVEAVEACQFVPDSRSCGPRQVCDADEGCISRPCAGDDECDDGFLCNGRERCSGRGVCVAGRPMRCEDGVECTVDVCSEAAGGCTSSPNHAACDDGRFCNGVETCDSRRGCQRGEPVGCFDGDDCTLDRCDERRDRCVFEPNPECVMPECPFDELGSEMGRAVARGTTVGAPRFYRGSCGGDGAPERTFEWRAPTSDVFRFDTRGSRYDTILYVLESCDEPELRGACDDDGAGGTQSQVDVFLREGQSVIVVVDGWDEEQGPFVLNIAPVPGPDGGLDGGTCTRAETGFQCADGLDNDCDGLRDCADRECRFTPFCRDAGIPDSGTCTPSELSWMCADGLDNDCDGRPDCADRDCFFTAVCRDAGPPDSGTCVSREIGRLCRNGRDDDCDGRPDCADPDCFFSPLCEPDAGRPDASLPDGGMCEVRELGVAMCTDGVDNDCDARRDCDDSDCSPFGPEGECCDGLDDDGDGQVDLFTCRCSSDADCRGVGSLDQVCWTALFSVCAPRCNFLGGDSFCREIDPSFRCQRRTGQCVPTRGPVPGPDPVPPPEP